MTTETNNYIWPSIDDIKQHVIDCLIENITSWDCNAVSELKNWFDELALALEETGEEALKIEEIIDISNLPSSDKFNPNNTDYPIWAWDDQGMCLAGDTMDTICSLSDCH